MCVAWHSGTTLCLHLQPRTMKVVRVANSGRNVELQGASVVSCGMLMAAVMQG
jgi:hypothetical protein